MKNILLSISLFALCSFIPINSSNWSLKEGYVLRFSSENPNGIFRNVIADIAFDSKALDQSMFDIQVEVKSINTGNAMQNRHALSKDWFDAENYPYISFKSGKIREVNGNYIAEGKMNIKGTPKWVKIPFEFDGKEFKGSFKVNRIDYGIGGSDGRSKEASTLIKVDFRFPVQSK